MKRDIVLRNDAAELVRLEEELGAFGREEGIGADDLHDMRLALEEAVVNVIRHGYRDAGEHAIRVRMEREGGSLRFEIRDDGVPFNPLDAAPPDTSVPHSERGTGGMGIPLLRHAVDTLEYRREGETNVLLMSKRQAPR